MKKHSNSAKKSEQRVKQAKWRGPVQRDTKEVLAELVGKLKEKLDRKVGAASVGEEHQRDGLRPNLDRALVKKVVFVTEVLPILWTGISAF